uniref:Sodium/solute symporter n=2 Tax=Photinus pyralis TaxID=7054 RepID=A0A1Y1M8K2_PHOPY
MFYIIDYVVFFGMLLISVIIGVYFGFCGKTQTKDDYLLGGKSMSVIPIALSLIAGHVSGITLLALPSDVYLYGANYLWISVALLFVGFLTCYVYLPVIAKLQSASVFDYLDRRFNRKIRMLASFLFALQLILYNPVVAYIPAIAFSQASGISAYLITPIVCIVCTFYTTIGGFKAVVWTDALQFTAMIGAIVAIFSLGVQSVGGFANMFTKASEGQRFDFDFSLDPTIREGFFPILLGGTVLWLYNVALQPPSVQKYISVSSLSNARRASVILIIGLVILKVSNVLIGTTMYVRYEKCDPLSTGEVTRTDQILPYFVMDVAKHLPGLPGLFIAGIFSAGLSTLSTMFNTLSATIYNDFVVEFSSANVSERRTNYTLKLIVIVSGTVCTILTFFIDKMGGLFHFVNASQGLIAGLFVGLFSLGMIYPIANAKVWSLNLY